MKKKAGTAGPYIIWLVSGVTSEGFMHPGRKFPQQVQPHRMPKSRGAPGLLRWQQSGVREVGHTPSASMLHTITQRKPASGEISGSTEAWLTKRNRPSIKRYGQTSSISIRAKQTQQMSLGNGGRPGCLSARCGASALASCFVLRSAHSQQRRPRRRVSRRRIRLL